MENHQIDSHTGFEWQLSHTALIWSHVTLLASSSTDLALAVAKRKLENMKDVSFLSKSHQKPKPKAPSSLLWGSHKDKDQRQSYSECPVSAQTAGGWEESAWGAVPSFCYWNSTPITAGNLTLFKQRSFPSPCGIRAEKLRLKRYVTLSCPSGYEKFCSNTMAVHFKDSYYYRQDTTWHQS